MATTDFSGLLSSTRDAAIGACHFWICYTVYCPQLGFNIISPLLQLISESIPVLLEDEGSKASSEEHDKRVLVLMGVRRQVNREVAKHSKMGIVHFRHNDMNITT